jgi:hypothetical protein
MRLELHYAGQSRLICFHSQDAAKPLIYSYLALLDCRSPGTGTRHVLVFHSFAEKKYALTLPRFFTIHLFGPEQLLATSCPCSSVLCRLASDKEEPFAPVVPGRGADWRKDGEFPGRPRLREIA